MRTCGASLAKMLLFVVNAILWVIGALLLGLGIWATVDTNFNNIWKSLAEGQLAGRLPNVQSIAITIIVMGAVIFAFGFAGCCGACRESRCLLSIYIVLMGIVMAAEVAVAILAFVFRAQIPGEIQKILLDSTKKLTGQQDVGYNFLLAFQFEAKCCGANNYLDYFNYSAYQNQTNPPENCYAVPITCCVRNSNFTDGWAKLKYTDVVDGASCCNKGSRDSKGRFDEGCYTKMSDIIEKFMLPIGIGLIVFAVFQVVIMVTAVCLCQAIKQENSGYN